MLKEEKELELKRTMEMANKSMIEKERFHEAITNIKRSPKTKLLNQTQKTLDSQKEDF